MKLAIWEDKIGQLDEDVCYKMVKTWKGKNYLMTAKGKRLWREN